MSYNSNDPERAAKRHTPAIIGIVVAVLAAVVLFFVFQPGAPNEGGDGIATTAPDDATLTEAEGIDPDAETSTDEPAEAGTPSN